MISAHIRLTAKSYRITAKYCHEISVMLWRHQIRLNIQLLQFIQGRFDNLVFDHLFWNRSSNNPCS